MNSLILGPMTYSVWISRIQYTCVYVNILDELTRVII